MSPIIALFIYFLISASLFTLGAFYGAYLANKGHKLEIEKRLEAQKAFYQKALAGSMGFSSRLVRELNALESQLPKRGERGRFICKQNG
jgi:hypothetical protein